MGIVVNISRSFINNSLGIVGALQSKVLFFISNLLSNEPNDITGTMYYNIEGIC